MGMNSKTRRNICLETEKKNIKHFER